MTNKHLIYSQTPNHQSELGCVNKHEEVPPSRSPSYPNCAYRHNGYNTTLGTWVKRKLYDIDFTRERHKRRLPAQLPQEQFRGKSGTQTPSNPLTIQRAWSFGTGDNFRDANTPYTHNHHHILPWDSLQALDYNELVLLKQAHYNINAGLNIIILPCHPVIGRALMLPFHPYNHPTYNLDCVNIINSIKRKKSSSRTNHSITSDNASTIKDKLNQWSQLQYWKIVKYGRRSALDPSTGSGIINEVPMASRSAITTFFRTAREVIARL